MANTPNEELLRAAAIIAQDSPMVKVPGAMYRALEKRAMRATELEQTLSSAGAILKGYRIFAVITRPVSGMDAGPILTAVQALVVTATGIKDA